MTPHDPLSHQDILEHALRNIRRIVDTASTPLSPYWTLKDAAEVGDECGRIAREALKQIEDLRASSGSFRQAAISSWVPPIHESGYSPSPPTVPSQPPQGGTAVVNSPSANPAATPEDFCGMTWPQERLLVAMAHLLVRHEELAHGKTIHHSAIEDVNDAMYEVLVARDESDEYTTVQ